MRPSKLWLEMIAALTIAGGAAAFAYAPLARKRLTGGGLPMRHFIVVLSALLLLGCSQQQMLQKFSTPADQAVAEAYISDLQARRFDAIEKDLDPSIKTPDVHATLVRMAGFFPAGAPTSIKLVGAHRMYSPAGVQTSTSFEYRWGDKWLLCSIAIQKTKTTITILGFNINPEKESLEDQTRFTLAGKSPAQYAILAGAVLAFSLTLYALVICIRTRGLRRKWLWILFILVGFGLLSANWTTGEVGYQLVYITLFSAGAFAPLYGPWTITMSAPVGAMVFLWRRWQRARELAEALS